MIENIICELKNKVNDDTLVENLIYGYQKITEEFIAQKPVDLLQNTGLFVECVLRVSEHLIFGNHTSLKNKLDISDTVNKLEKASGSEGLRIYIGRLSRVLYDFRTRKKSVHLKAVDPQIIDANLVFNISTWILIEIFKESGVSNTEESIRLLFTRKIPLVQSVGGVLRTTNPKLHGPQRILLLLYASLDGMTEDQLFNSTKQKIKYLKYLRAVLRNMDSTDMIHQLDNGKWIIFGRGFIEAEKLIGKLA